MQSILDWLDSEEGQLSVTKYAEKLNNKKEILYNQLKRFHNSIWCKDIFLFEELIRKIENKYESIDYINRHYKRGYEPPEYLYWFLFEYAEKYGREITNDEYDKYCNMFTSAGYVINGYLIHVMDGQGSVIKIIKI